MDEVKSLDNNASFGKVESGGEFSMSDLCKIIIYHCLQQLGIILSYPHCAAIKESVEYMLVFQNRMLGYTI
jgi:hypothetical protein